LLGAAIVAGSAVEGGVVAYQVGWVFFLAPYAILAQPIHTAILPELVTEAGDDDRQVFAASTRWALERMAVLVVPVAAGMIALAGPGMRAVSFGQASAGADLLAAALVGLAVGLYPYGAFLLLARAFYARGDSRGPGVVALVSAAVGVLVMLAGAALTDGVTRVAILGLGHSAAYALGAVVLFVRLGGRLGASIVPAALGRIVLVAAVVGVAAWAVQRALLGGDPGRLADVIGVSAIALAGGALVLGGYRLLGVHGSLSTRVAPSPLASGDVGGLA
jgi:putative peptidoglycan lipid II flippase